MLHIDQPQQLGVLALQLTAATHAVLQPVLQAHGRPLAATRLSVGVGEVAVQVVLLDLQAGLAGVVRGHQRRFHGRQSLLVLLAGAAAAVAVADAGEAVARFLALRVGQGRGRGDGEGRRRGRGVGVGGGRGGGGGAVSLEVGSRLRVGLGLGLGVRRRSLVLSLHWPGGG